jgi:outer membrane lipoprotein LolB
MMLSTDYKKALLISCTFLLAGCVSMALPTVNSQFEQKSWSQRKTALAKIHSWNIDGAFSIQSQKQTNIANYTWKQKGNTYQIQMHSSLDLYNVYIAGTPGAVELKESNKKALRAKTPEALMRDRLGWSLPISNLAYWIKGLPAPGKYQSTFDRYNHLMKLKQQGWQITFSNYINVKQTAFPRALQIQGHGLRIKIVMKNWSI